MSDFNVSTVINACTSCMSCTPKTFPCLVVCAIKLCAHIDVTFWEIGKCQSFMLGYPKKQIDIGREVILFSYKFTRNSATAYFVFVNKHFKLLKGLGIMSKYVYKIMTLLCGFNKLTVSNTLNDREDFVKHPPPQVLKLLLFVSVRLYMKITGVRTNGLIYYRRRTISINQKIGTGSYPS